MSKVAATIAAELAKVAISETAPVKLIQKKTGPLSLALKMRTSWTPSWNEVMSSTKTSAGWKIPNDLLSGAEN